MFHRTFHVWDFTWEISNVKFHIWNVTWEFSRVISHVKFHMRLFTCDVSHVKFHMWLFPCDISHVKFHMWPFTCDFTCEVSHVKFHMWNFTCERQSRVKFHMWKFICDISHVKHIMISHVKIFMCETHGIWNSHVILEPWICESHGSHMRYFCKGKCHSIGHKMRIARIKIRVDSQGRWERAYGEGTQFWRGVFWVWNGILVEKTSFGYQKGWNSRAVNRWQRKPFCQVMIGHIWNGKNKGIRRSCRNRMWRELWKTIVKICRIVVVGCWFVSVLYVRRQVL